MHKFSRWLAAALVTLGAAATLSAQSVEPTKGVLRVKLQPEVAGQLGNAPLKAAKGRLSTGISTLDRASSQIKAMSIRPMLPYSPQFAEQRARYGLDRWYVVSFDESMPVAQARKVLAATPGIELTEAVTPMVLKEGTGGFRSVSRPPMKAAGVDYFFNDPRLPDQWHYQNFGNIGTAVRGADINLFEAWKSETGRDKVTVAIIDGGVDYRHEDLAANMLANEAELNGQPGVDDDGNGFVDDIYGYNFCTNSGEIYPHNHGTHVAGTVAAVNNNGIGVAGVAGGDGTPGSGVKMISCQVFDPRQGSGDGDFAAAIVYAAERGATIAQCSWGWAEPEYYEQAVFDAIDYFTETARSDNMTGGLCIFATGNNGATGNYYPAAYDKVLAVTAMTNELQPASYSNYGPWVDLIAPGGLLDYGEAAGVLSTLPNNEYGYSEGTSMATPHVSGIAALVLSRYGSPTFVSSSLRTQLETSVNDFYGYGDNERFRGLYGSGYIDAAKALQMGDGAAPSPVADFSLEAAQDYISLTWTIPASSDNNVHHHIIYYSESPFSASSDLSALKSTVADTKFVSSGDTFTHEITGLKPITTYYVALAAVNRWGNASALSPVKQISTNAGPQMSVDATGLFMNSSAGQPVATASFNISNEAEGILKWSAYKRTASVMPASVSRPAIGRVHPYTGTLGSAKVKAATALAADYDAADYPAEIKYYSEIWAYIGDTDRSLPNSMAQWFRVDPSQYPDGFNLTHLNIDGAYGANPVIQIFKGDVAISSASLLQTVDYPYFAYGYPVALNEQIHFAPGESFWVAVHFEGGQEGYPLCMAEADVDGIAGYSYMSNDGGRNWTQLSAALRGSAYEDIAANMTWAITARSANPDWSEVLVLNPASGTVLGGEKQTVEVSADGSHLVNGTYSLNLHLTANQSDGAETLIPVTYTVSGNTPDIVTPRIVNFGSLLVGESKTLTVEIYNRGYGKFAGSQWDSGLYADNISSTSVNFHGPENGVQQGFPARTRTRVELTYAPVEAGSHTGNIIFTDVDGRQARIVVQGVATEPAKLAIEPATIDAGTLTVGAGSVQKSFKISNNGKYPLEFVFPRFSQETIEGGTATLHKYGYTVSSTLEGYNTFAYDGNPDLVGATDISSQFTDDNYVSSAIKLGFAFPYYGKTYDRVYITSFGGIMFAPNDETFRTPLTPTSSAVRGTGLISAYGQQLLMNPQSRVEYSKSDGKFVVKFINVLASVYDKDYIPVSFHIALSGNGDIEMFYDDYMPDAVFQSGSGLFCGINDPDCADAVTITSADQADIWGMEEPTPDNQRFRSFGTGTAVKFGAPKPYFVQNLNLPYGMVNPGESVEITATLAADATMNAGPTFNNLAIATNDPAPAHSFVRFDAVIDGEELIPVAALERTAIDLGDVFRTSVQKAAVTIVNNGHRALDVTAVRADKGLLAFSAELPFTLEAGMAKDIIVTVPTANEGAVADRITVETSAGNLSADIKANVIGCPEIALSLTEVTETLESGTPLVKELTVTNSGNEPLTYAITPDPLVRLTLPDNPDAVTSYDYSFSGDDSNVKFDWIDIETNGLGTQHGMTYYNLHDYVEVELPFEFPFYGRKYNKMYVYNTGFVSFTERHDDRIWPEPPAEFPEGSVYTNIIAPYWGMHTMDQTRTAGTFHYVTDDRAVISFIEYGNSMNIGVDFQLVLFKDGSFKFQYKPAFDEAVIYGIFGLAGIANADGSSSIRLPERMVSFGNAVAFSPVVEAPVAPGNSETVTLDFDTRRLAGTYSTALKVATNVPGSENIEIPVTLDITGKADPQWPADVTVENVLGYRSTDYSDPLVQMGAMYAAYFNVDNNGTAAFTIDNIEIDGPKQYDEWMDTYFDIFPLFVKQESIDWITGEPTGEKIWGQYEPGFTVLNVTDEPLEFAIPMMEGESAYTPGEYNIRLTFHATTEAGEQQRDVNVKFVVTPAPAITLDREEVYVKATGESDTFSETVVLGNDGEYKLSYNITLDPTGVGEETDPDQGGGIAPWSRKARKAAAVTECTAVTLARVPADKASSTSIYDVPGDFEYRNALYYPAAPLSPRAYNYGSNSQYDIFKAATLFTAPAEGFNVSHIYLPVNIETATDYEVILEVVTGNVVGEGDVIGRGKLIIESQADPQVGQFFAVALDKPAFLNPGEEFYVQVTYAAGVKFPAYVVTKEEAMIEGRYMGWTEANGWFDVAALFEEQYGSLGYILTCLETAEGKPWIKLLTPAGDAELETGSTAEIKLEINAAAARLEKNNKAMIVIKGNDPVRPLINLPVILDKNGAPVIDVPAGIIYAKEGTVTNVPVTVSDPDTDNFTVAFNDARGNATISVADAGTATVTTGDDGTISVADAFAPVKFNVAIKPDYGSASTGNIFDLTVTDIHGLSAEASVRYSIEHVNRAPVAAEAPVIAFAAGTTSGVYSFADMFTDPDGDELTYTFDMPQSRYVDAYPNATGVIFYGKHQGKATATVTATDPSGATATIELPVEVKDASGISDATADTGKISVTPNPIDGDINVYAGFTDSEALFVLYDASGRQVFSIRAAVNAGEATVLPGAGLAQGIYILTVTADGTTSTVRIVKP